MLVDLRVEWMNLSIVEVSIQDNKKDISNTMRQRVFGCHLGSLEWLATRPGDIVAYERKTLVNLDA